MGLKLKEIRECIWPLLEPFEEVEYKDKKIEDVNIEENNIDLMLNYIEKFLDSEERRKNQVESKATIFIGTFGVVITVLFNLIKDNKFQTIQKLIILIAIIYLCRAIWFSIKALEKRNYHKLGFPSFMFRDSDTKKKELLVTQYNIVKKNQSEINLKVDYMTMAQEYFKRAIIVVACGSVFIFISSIILYKFTNIEFIMKIHIK